MNRNEETVKQMKTEKLNSLRFLNDYFMKLKRITSKRRQNYFSRRPSQLQARTAPPSTCLARGTVVSRLGLPKKVHTHSILF